MALLEPDLRRTWLFGPGADASAHVAMLASDADVLIIDLEDFTLPNRRNEAREAISARITMWRERGKVAAVRINALETEGLTDLAAAMPGRPHIVAYPMTSAASQMYALHAAISHWERALAIPAGATEILPVCETAAGVVDVRNIVAGSSRIRCALLGAEDLAADLCAERQPDAIELDHARRRFLLECRAAGIEPVDAPYTYTDVQGAEKEARYARRLGYRCKSLVRTDHAEVLNRVLTPSEEEIARAVAVVSAFEAARGRGEDRALVEGQWVEVPTYRNAKRTIERARRLTAAVSDVRDPSLRS
jgi:citrate lyase subunit beta/citryl-CoA lyase